MRQRMLNWLRLSSFLVLPLFSCKKKEKRVFDDFPPGKFDFIWIWDVNGTKDTLVGEVSGPYPIGDDYFFRRYLKLGEDKLAFEVQTYDNVELKKFGIQKPFVHVGHVINSQISHNKLIINYMSGDTLIGSYNLTRK